MNAFTFMLSGTSGRFRPDTEERDAPGTLMLSETSGRGDPMILSPPEEGPHPYIVCDGCKKPIGNRIRYKCLKCIDFDLCADCEASPNSHFGGAHLFMKIRNSRIVSKEQLQSHVRVSNSWGFGTL